MSKPKKPAFCTMDAEWSICCTSAKENHLGINKPENGCQCSQNPGGYYAYRMESLPKFKKPEKPIRLPNIPAVAQWNHDRFDHPSFKLHGYEMSVERVRSENRWFANIDNEEGYQKFCGWYDSREDAKAAMLEWIVRTRQEETRNLK